MTIKVQLMGAMDEYMNLLPNSYMCGVVLETEDDCVFLPCGTTKEMKKFLHDNANSIVSLVAQAVRKSENVTAHEIWESVMENEESLIINGDMTSFRTILEELNETGQD